MNAVPSGDRSTSDRPDAIARFGWSLHHHRRLAVLVFVAVLAAVLAVGTLTGTTTYRTQAVVVPSSLGEDLDPLRLSRFQEAMLENGGVLEAAVARDGIPYADREALSAQVELVPVEDNIFTSVVGSADDPQVAANVANVVAQELVLALNRAGGSVGEFQVLTQATVPVEPDRPRGLGFLGLLGAAGGLAAALGTVGLVSTLRRPVLAPQDAALAVEGPALGRLRTASQGRRIDPSGVLGLSALVRRLYPEADGICAFVAPAGSEDANRQVASLVARMLARQASVEYVTERDGHDVPRELQHPQITFRARLADAPEGWSPHPTVVEGPNDVSTDLPQYLPAAASIVVVVAKGCPAARLEELKEQFLPGQISGVLMVEHDLGRRGPGGRAAQPQQYREATPKARSLEWSGGAHGE